MRFPSADVAQLVEHVLVWVQVPPSAFRDTPSDGDIARTFTVPGDNLFVAFQTEVNDVLSALRPADGRPAEGI